MIQRIAFIPVILALQAPAWCADGGKADAPLPAGDPDISAKAAILVDVESGQTLWERNADEVRYPASLTKVMTVLLALERCTDLDELVTVSKRAAEIGEASAYLQPEDQLLLRDLLVACVLRSANDASVAVAEHVSGSLESFVGEMNARAAELGMDSTTFANPNGLHVPEHVSSARDLATVSRQAMSLPAFRRLAAMQEGEITYHRAGGEEKRTFPNTNRFLLPEHEHYWELADGAKTGYTRQAGRCLIGSAGKDGSRLLCVVLDCDSGWVDARALMEWGFQHYSYREVVVAGQTTAEVHVVGGERSSVMAVAKSSVSILMPVDAALPRVHVSEAFPVAPIEVDDPVAELVVLAHDGTEVRSTLIARNAVPQSIQARAKDHTAGLITGVLALTLLGALVLHGAVTKASGARRPRRPANVRRDDQGRARRRQRQDRDPSRTAGRPASRSNQR